MNRPMDGRDRCEADGCAKAWSCVHFERGAARRWCFEHWASVYKAERQAREMVAA